jgi:hypothetical protein
MKNVRLGVLLALALSGAAAGAACGGGGKSTFDDDTDHDAGTGAEAGIVDDATVDDSPVLVQSDSEVTSDASSPITIAPADLVIDVNNGQPVATQQYTAVAGGTTVGAQWSMDRGEIGKIDPASGVFTPTGNIGGKATITASYKGRTATTSVTVRVHITELGDPNAPDAGGGAGGNGGVGGEGAGAPADTGQVAVLNGTPLPDAALSFLYPYDKTVWPRGILAPLLQWSAGAHQFDAVYIHITEAAFEYKGYFKKTADPFIHHPVPQAIWKQLAYSNQGEDVKVTLTFAETAQNKAYGPITESWKIAQGTLKGTVYYTSYGTNLAIQTNYTGKDGAHFCGATLAIRGGSTDPERVAGTNGADDSSCRVCHSVSANGSVLVTQHGEGGYATSAMYDLKNGNVESTVGTGPRSFPAIYPDGTFLLSNSSTSSLLIDLRPGNLGKPITATGGGFAGFTPAFSPDGTHVAYDDHATNKLSAIDFVNASKTFSNPRALYTPPGGQHAYWPSFLPTNDGVVFQLETEYNGRDEAGTRSRCEDPSGTNVCHNRGTHAELWWVDLATKTAARLDKANGVGYLPLHDAAFPGDANQGIPSDKDKDAEFNYEPTVNPVPSGGYAWIVFTSRRMYGNVATVNPFWSDPRFRTVGTGSKIATTKKLWVAAIDLNAPPGTDPSHPAFYLPAQELLAGNSRGFWVVDPCHADGSSCETGDECCGGFCRPSTDGGLVCSATAPGCAQEFEKCNVTADCCGNATGIECINGRCATQGPR